MTGAMFASPLRRLILITLLVLGGCATTAAAPGARDDGADRAVLLVSIDGFRADYLERGLTPNLQALANRGAYGAMRPSFPSKTFPNHYTLVTGLRPDRHGLVDNVMLDPQLPGRTFTLSDRTEVTDPVWWGEGLPIWVSAQAAGLSTAVLFWPGSEAPVAGVQPDRWRIFDMAMSAEARADQMLAWLDEAPDRGPSLMALYFDEVDSYGHWHGPDSDELNAALIRTDAAIGRLLAGLEARGRLESTDVIVVSDHGMAETSRERVIALESLVAPEQGRVLSSGVHLTFVPADGQVEAAEAALLRPHPHMECWRKAELPARFAYGRHRRVADIFCLAATGWEILPAGPAARRPPVGGAHGYDPADPTMAAIFIAAGPRIAPAARLPIFDNVDVYPLLASLLGVAPAANDGDAEVLRPILRP